MSDYNTLAELITGRKDYNSHGVGIIQDGGGELYITYADLYRSSIKFLYSLQKTGYEKGDQVIFQINDIKLFLYAFWACILGGMIPVPVAVGTSDEHKRKLQRVWDILDRPKIIASAQCIESSGRSTAGHAPSKSYAYIMKKAVCAEEAAGSQNDGGVYLPKSGDTAFIQFSSGSTGNPKGVVLTHKNIIFNLYSVLKWCHIGEGDASMSWLPLTHDMGLIGVHIKEMLAGIDQYLMQTELFIKDPELWMSKTSEHRATLLYSPNFGYRHLLKYMKPDTVRDWDLSNVRIIYNGAESISSDLCVKFLDRMSEYGLKRSAMFPAYGLAEGTIAETFPLPGENCIPRTLDRGKLEIGQTVEDAAPGSRDAVTFMDLGYPIGGCSVYISDEKGNDLGENKIGYVEIKGENVTSGYYNDEAATKSAISENGWLNTGDLGFMRGGRLTLTGRAKDVIVVSGRNYYCQDIERIADGIEGMEPGATVAVGIFDCRRGCDMLALFVLFSKNLNEFLKISEKLKKAVGEKLGIEVSEVLPVENMPKTASGKVQRFKLSEAYLRGEYDSIKKQIRQISAEDNAGKKYVPPRTQTEKKMAEIWSEVLDAGKIGIYNDFFSLGGDSLKITRLLSRMSDVFGVNVGQAALFDNPDIEGLSKTVDRLVRESENEKNKKIKKASTGKKRFPLSFAQQRLWFLDRLGGKSPQYNLYAALLLKGRLNINALNESFDAVFRRHDALRMSFYEEDGVPYQELDPNAGLELCFDSLESIPEDERMKKAVEIANAEAAKPFDLGKAPLIRGRLVRIKENEHVLILAVHHIVFDGWSFGVLMKELSFYYTASINDAGAELPKMKMQYQDYAVWQKDYFEKGNLESGLSYWRKQLSGSLPQTWLPADRPRPDFPTGRGGKITSTLPGSLLAELKSIACENDSTLFMVLLAAFYILLYKYTGRTDIIVGSPAACRGRKEFEDIIGLFTNNIVLRTSFSEKSDFRGLLSKVKNTVTGAYSNQEVPFEKLVDMLHVKRDVGSNPLFQVFFGMQIVPREILSSQDIDISFLELDGGYSRFDLSLDVNETVDGLRLCFEFSSDIYKRETVEQMAQEYGRLLYGIAADPGISIDKIETLTEREENILDGLNETKKYFEYEDFVTLFKKQEAKTPDATAAVCNDRNFTYRELDEWSDGIAQLLISNGAGPGSIAGVYMSRSAEMLAALIGVQKAGAVYLPMDPIFPRRRLEYIIGNAKAGIILTQKDLADSLPHGRAKIIFPGSEPPAEKSPYKRPSFPAVSPDANAYLIYTSGSTGSPKGVLIKRSALANILLSMRDITGISKDDTVLAVTTISFDIAGLELYLPLICGAKAVIAQKEDTVDGARLVQMITEYGITFMQATPVTWRLMVAAGWGHSPGLTALCGGEVLPRDLADSLLQRCKSVFNVYGPTETTIWSTAEKLTAGPGPVAIGKPVANTYVYILDKAMDRVPVGVPGELYIGGKGLATGYFDLAEETREKFVPSPFHKGERIYKTGDLAKCTVDGKLQYIGRIDGQIKLRGYRIEPGEIEAQLRKIPQVKDCAVVKKTINGEESLVAYFIPSASENSGGSRAIREYLKERFPGYMVPSAFVYMDAFPTTPNGKTDRRALPDPEMKKDGGLERNLVTGETEKTIAAIWSDVLDTGDFGADTNFFDAGGNSLLLPKVKSRLEKALGREVRVMDLFRYPTVASLAEHFKGGQTPGVHAGPKTTDIKAGNGGVAVIGMSGRFPGAKNLDEFWDNLCAGRESISHFTDGEAEADGADPELLKKPQYVKAWGVLNDIDRFDGKFFGYNPKEAELLDPQQRIFLEESLKAIENAGYDPGRFKGPVGVFGSVGMNTYARNIENSAGLAGDYQVMTGNDKDFLATRVAYKLGLEGPGITVQSACSSSLAAVHLACRSLIDGECDMALAGGVSVRLPQRAGYMYQEGMILSPDGHCRAFDRKAGGTVGGNGAGVVVLKRLCDAVRDGDSINAVIKGTAMSNDGSKKIGYTAPSIDGEARAVAAAQKKAGTAPDTISYIEAHGTGTPLGDPIEMEALGKVFEEKTGKKGFCAIGSVKTNIGHLDAASGIAGFIKTVLSIRNRKLPPSLHFEAPNPKINFADSPFYVNDSLKEWKTPSGPLRAGVSSFGIGGTNVHAVLEEAPKEKVRPAGHGPCLLIFSAKNAKSLDRATARFGKFIGENKKTDIYDAAYTLQMGRKEFTYRRYLVCDSVNDALKIFENGLGDVHFHDNVKNPASDLSYGSPVDASGISLEEAGERWLRGENIRWEDLYKNRSGRRIPLPAYPLEGQSYWALKRKATSHTAANTDKNDVSEWFYTPLWRQSASPALPSVRQDEAVLVLRYKNPETDFLISKIKERGCRPAEACPGNDYSTNEGRYEFDPSVPSHYVKLLTDVMSKGKKSLRVVDMLGLTGSEVCPCSEQSVRRAMELYFSMQYLGAALGDLASDMPVEIKTVTDDSVRIFGEKTVYPEKAVQLGACRVIPLECQNARCCNIDISSMENEDMDAAADEILSDSKETQTAIRGGDRWTQKYEKIKLNTLKTPAVKLREGGVYLITGGIGGLGLAFAEFLAGRVKARLVLTGRSEFPAEAKWDDWIMSHAADDAVSQKIEKLKCIKALGTEVHICRSDVTDAQQARQLREMAEGRFGHVDGIIHAAGVPGGGMIRFRKREDAEKVFSPKVWGTINLYQAFKGHKPDFMLLCSSLNAVTGGFGQSDYSGANAFMDAFAENVRNTQTRIISVEWDRWTGVGMAAENVKTARVVNPVLGKLVSSGDAGAVYMNVLGPDKDWVLSEHRVLSVPTVAGATYLEMARGAFEDLIGPGPVEFSDVVFLTPLTVKPGGSRRVFTQLNKSGAGYYFRISSRPINEEPGMTETIEHARGRIVPCGKEDLRYDIMKLKKECGAETIYPDKTKRETRKDFISFSGRWTSLVGFKKNKSFGLAKIELPKRYISDMSVYKLHPALLDEATGVVRLAANGDFLPFSYGKLRLYGKLSSKIYSYIKYRESGTDDDTITCDIDILGEEGERQAMIEGFSMRRATGAVSAAASLSKEDSPDDGSIFKTDEGITADEGREALQMIFDGCKQRRIAVSVRPIDTAIRKADYAQKRKAAVADTGAMHPRPDIDTEYVPPRNGTEKALTGLWEGVLHIEKIGVYDDFFVLGGDSLLLIQLYSQIKEKFATDMPIVDLYKFKTVALQAKRIRNENEDEGKADFEKINRRVARQLEFRKRKRRELRRDKE